MATKIILLFSLFLSFITSQNLYSLSENTYTATWASSQYLTESFNVPPIPLTNNTIRQIVHVSISGEILRVKFSNRCGEENLEINAANIAYSLSQGSGEIDPNTLKTLTFNGYKNVVIPPGEEIYSDSFSYVLEPQSEIAITTYFGKLPEGLTSHAGSRTFSFIEEGNQLSKQKFSDEIKTAHWYVITAIEVSSENHLKTVVCFGDSITDGRGSTDDKQNRWTDRLSYKLYKNLNTRNVGCVNEGIGATFVNANGLERFNRDVAEIKGAGYIVMLYGVNDILFQAATSDFIINTYKELIRRAHKNNLYIYGATILPFGNNNNYTPEKEKVRKAVNEWILNTLPENGGFDASFDFAKSVADPNNEEVLNSIYDCGDGLHPSPEGYEQMVTAIEDLDLFKKEANFNVNENLESLNLKGVQGVKFKLDTFLGVNENVNVTVKGNSKGSNYGFRVWTVNRYGERTSQIFRSGAIEKGEFNFELKFVTKEFTSHILVTSVSNSETIADNIYLDYVELKAKDNDKIYSPKDEFVKQN